MRSLLVPHAILSFWDKGLAELLGTKFPGLKKTEKDVAGRAFLSLSSLPPIHKLHSPIQQKFMDVLYCLTKADLEPKEVN